MTTPLVSISCITYNHAPYIRECLEGFLMQKTNFPFEILIHDDASTDGTADIIREYEAKYPDIIKPIYQTENQYSKGVRRINELYNFSRAQGKYIALCEGDDFWTDPNKLQIQFDFMESHPDYSLCMHGRYNLDYFNKRYYPEPFANIPENGLECAHKLAAGMFMSFTQTFLLRKAVLYTAMDAIKRDSEGAPMGDIQHVFHFALHGNIKYFRKHMATYRRAVGSVTHSVSGDNLAFLQRCEDFTVAMLINSGYTDWAKERELIYRKTELSLPNKRRNMFQVLRYWLGKVHFSLFKLRGKIKFWLYMKKHR